MKKCLWCGRVCREEELDLNEHDEPAYCPTCGHDQFQNVLPHYYGEETEPAE